MTASEKLRRLAAEATPGPWSVAEDEFGLYVEEKRHPSYDGYLVKLDRNDGRDAHDAHLDHAGHEFDACPWQKCRETRAILADADRLFGNDTEKEDR